MSKKVWYGVSIGAVVGPGAGEDASGMGGAKSGNSDSDSSNGGQGLFSLWGREVWLYVGGVLGFGDKAGVYLTTGPMIGKNPDWAIGAGVHLGKAIGLGVVIPAYAAYKSYERHQDKVGAYIETGQQMLAKATDVAHAGMARLPEITQTLDTVVNTVV